MDELVDLIVGKTGLSKEQAKSAIDLTVGFIKKKLPAPIAGQIDGFLNGQNLSQNLGAGLGSLFGKK